MANPFLGVTLHAVGGGAAGSFYVPFRRVRAWAWESYWLVSGVAAWVLAPAIGALLTVPNAYAAVAGAPIGAKALAFLFGALWGIGGLTFGLSMRYLGLSLGYAVALGFCAFFGFIVPPIVHGKAADLFVKASGQVVVLGLVVCLAGIARSARAGLRKETEVSDDQKKATVREFSLTKGLLVAAFSGIMSACMAFGLDAGKPIAEAALRGGAPDIFKNNAVLIVVLAGGFTTNFLWCVALNLRNRTARDYLTGGAPQLVRNYGFSAMAGVIWYLQFFFYGMGTTQMGKYDYSSWTIHMAFIIAFSSLWGIGFREWQGVSRKTMAMVWSGIGLLVLSTVVIGIGNYLAR